MIRNQKSSKSKNTQLFVLALSVLAVLLAQQVQQAYASNFFGDLGNAIDRCVDNCVDNYNQGTRDGKQAALAGEAKNCPGNGADYCLGWNSGYNKISNAQNDLNEAQQDGENYDDNNGGGTTEDDGEFVEDDNNNNNNDD